MLACAEVLCVLLLFVSFPAAFCLPLDIISQVAINVIFFCLHFPPTVTQVSGVLACSVCPASRTVPAKLRPHRPATASVA